MGRKLGGYSVQELLRVRPHEIHKEHTRFFDQRLMNGRLDRVVLQMSCIGDIAARWAALDALTQTTYYSRQNVQDPDAHSRFDWFCGVALPTYFHPVLDRYAFASGKGLSRQYRTPFIASDEVPNGAPGMGKYGPENDEVEIYQEMDLKQVFIPVSKMVDRNTESFWVSPPAWTDEMHVASATRHVKDRHSRSKGYRRHYAAVGFRYGGHHLGRTLPPYPISLF